MTEKLSVFDEIGMIIRMRIYEYVKSKIDKNEKWEVSDVIKFVGRDFNDGEALIVKHLLIDKIFDEYDLQIKINEELENKNKILVFENGNTKIYKDDKVKIKIGKCKKCGKAFQDPSTLNL